MFARIRQIFSKPKPSLSDESREFIEKLAPSFIWVLGIGIRGTPAMPTLYGPKAWDVIAERRIELADVGDSISNTTDGRYFPFSVRRSATGSFKVWVIFPNSNRIVCSLDL